MNGLFGLDFTQETADIYIVPACWELSVSYRYGTSKAPLHILESSYQLDLYHPAFDYAQTKFLLNTRVFGIFSLTLS